MDSLGDPFFSNLFQGGSNIDKQFVESQFSVQKESVTKKPHGGNFSVEEDDMLVFAWLNTSLDAVQGNEQKNKTFWMRVWEYFHENKNFISERNDISLMNCWSVIQLATNKFCGYLAQVESMHESGKTDQYKIRDAKLKYQELSKSNTSFQFEHCWNVLKYIGWKYWWISKIVEKDPSMSSKMIAPNEIARLGRTPSRS